MGRSNICITIPLLVRKKVKVITKYFPKCIFSICIIICVIYTIEWTLTMEDTCLWPYMKRESCGRLHLVQEVAYCCCCCFVVTSSCCLAVLSPYKTVQTHQYCYCRKRNNLRSITVNLLALLTKLLDARIFRMVLKFATTVCSDLRFGTPLTGRLHWKYLIVFNIINGENEAWQWKKLGNL